MFRAITFLIVVLAFGAASANAQDEVELAHRIVFFPGLMSSELVVNDPARPQERNPEIVWGTARGAERNFQKLGFPIKAGTNGEYQDDAIRATRVLNDFALTSIFGWRFMQLDPAYGPFLNHLEEKVSQAKQDSYTAFAYDWRQSNVVSACQFVQWLGESKNAAWADNAKSKGLVLVGHSMGGIVARLFVEFMAPPNTAASEANPCPHQYKVFRLIAVQTPYFGSQKALKSFVKVIDSEMRRFQGSDEAGREVFFTIPSVYELLPSYKGCCLIKSLSATMQQRLPIDIFDENVWTNGR